VLPARKQLRLVVKRPIMDGNNFKDSNAALPGGGSDNDFGRIISGCLAGNSQAQRLLYKQYFGYAKSICIRYTSCPEEVDEVLNEGFLKVFTHLRDFDEAYPFKVWVRTIMINTAISYYRKHKKHTQYRASYEDAPYLGFEEDIVSQITEQEILMLTQQIKPIYKNVFLLYVVDGYNHREIARLLEINEATVRSHYLRARVQLQNLIKANYPDLFKGESKAQNVSRQQDRHLQAAG
jgi:RNA polymerase sigma-70 factor (ECF subfamily)